ncbi:MAG: nicotinate phosphoribosyltransferase [Planctomycetes bacterium]|nr:nicotinate phosphoribosyltransferase [Planctomycetota bacterium]
MSVPTEIYRSSLALLTDLYELTMAYGYWKAGVGDREAVFNLFFRKHPFQSGFSIACGLSYVVDYLANFRFDDSDLAYLAELRGNDERPLFEPAFLDYLRSLEFDCDVDAVPEGTVVFPQEPLVRVRGPIIPSQIIETPLLNLINFQTLIATKAARICTATRGDPVLEFGLRRAQGIDGGLAVSRAAYVGGCAATSNVLAGKLFKIPVKGTHAHSWIMAFDNEQEAFDTYADAMPNNCVFLVDTYDTLEGVRHAVQVGRSLRERGHKMLGIRLDSGDLAYLSIEARRILDDAGFTDAVIVASNDLDEHIIASLKEQGATIGMWSVGTRLATAHDQPAMGGVYKLTAIRKPGQQWGYKLKVSEQAIKTSTPGIQQVRRFADRNEFIADMIYDEQLGPGNGVTLIDPIDSTRRRKITADTAHTDLLVPVFRRGRLVYDVPPLDAARQRAHDQLSRFHAGIRRFVNPHQYPVGLEQRLHELKTELILQARKSKE